MAHAQLKRFGAGGPTTRIECWAERQGGELWARWLVDVPLAQLRLAEPGPVRRRDDLWRTTCCEVFVAAAGTGYLEVNAAPTGDWAAYRFTGPREGMAPATLAAPTITLDVGDEWASVETTLVLPPDLASAPLSLNMAAVIETTDGALSHWALAHPAGRADFHDRSCFLLSLPAPG